MARILIKHSLQFGSIVAWKTLQLEMIRNLALLPNRLYFHNIFSGPSSFRVEQNLMFSCGIVLYKCHYRIGSTLKCMDDAAFLRYKLSLSSDSVCEIHGGKHKIIEISKLVLSEKVKLKFSLMQKIQ